jgi:hypothetical protein
LLNVQQQTIKLHEKEVEQKEGELKISNQRLQKSSQMLMDAELAIKRLNFGKAKLDEVLSFGRTLHDKIGWLR